MDIMPVPCCCDNKREGRTLKERVGSVAVQISVQYSDNLAPTMRDLYAESWRGNPRLLLPLSVHRVVSLTPFLSKMPGASPGAWHPLDAFTHHVFCRGTLAGLLSPSSIRNKGGISLRKVFSQLATPTSSETMANA